MNRRTFLKRASSTVVLSCCGTFVAAGNLFAKVADQIKVWSVGKGTFIMANRVEKSEHEWQKKLTPEQYKVTRKDGTERAFSGAYDKHYEAGVYQCIGCDQDLFHSDHKYDSGTGWPSYYQPIAIENIGVSKDSSWLTVRNEIHCSRCQGHLGHVFDDGPKPTGLRYCINSVSLKFIKA